MAQNLSNIVTLLPQGAIIQEFHVDGQNIVLGFADAEDYKTKNSAFFGENIGRVANRIGGARIERLNNRSYSLNANDGPNTLHGGAIGWGKREFEGPTTCQRDGQDAIMYKYISHHGEENFPGTVQVRVYYTPAVEQVDGVQKTSLGIEYEAELVPLTNKDDEEAQETVINLTNHSYFNISGQPSIEGTRVTLATNQHQVVSDDAIPTGEITAFSGVEANEEFVLGKMLPDFDHCFILDSDPASVPIDTRQLPLKQCLKMYHPETKLHFEALTSEPAFQFYTGKFIDIPATNGTPARHPRSGFCVEASRYVNAINDERWRNMVVLKRGQVYGSKTVYRSWRTT